jgi:hypothetical protein
MNTDFQLVYHCFYWCEACEYLDIRGPLDIPYPQRPYQFKEVTCPHCNRVLWMLGIHVPRIVGNRLHSLAQFGPKRKGK